LLQYLGLRLICFVFNAGHWFLHLSIYMETHTFKHVTWGKSEPNNLDEIQGCPVVMNEWWVKKIKLGNMGDIGYNNSSYFWLVKVRKGYQR